VDRTIDEIIRDLDRVVDRCWEADSRLGYFPAMYRKVTLRVRDGIAAGEFDDGERMERLDVTFAQRYLDAFEAHRTGGASTLSWARSFERAAHPEPVVLPHLLLGMNAHINLDLGIAAAQVCRGTDLEAMEGDFERVNDVLAGLVDEVQDAVDESAVLYRVLDVAGFGVDEAVAAFSIRTARRSAWSRATALHAAADPGALVTEYDDDTARLAATIARGTRVVDRLARLGSTAGEQLSPRQVIEALAAR
jgi:hypothetical protein